MGTSRIDAVVEFDYVAQEPDELTLRKGDVITNIKTQPGGWWEGTLGNKRGMFPDNFVKVVSEPPDSRMSNDVALRPVRGRKCKVLFSYAPVNEDELELQVDDIIHVVAEVEEGWWKGRLRDRVGVFPSNFVAEIEEKTVSSSSYISSSTAATPAITTTSGSMTTTTTASLSHHEVKPAHREEASESEGELSTSVSSPDSSQLLDSTGRSDQDTDSPLLPPKPVKEICRVLFPYEAANDDELTLKEGDLITLLSREVQDKGWWKGELRGQIGVFPDNFVEVIQQEEQPKKSERPPAKTQTTTNRARDSITKPVIPSGMSKLDLTEASQKKPPEVAATRSGKSAMKKWTNDGYYFNKSERKYNSPFKSCNGRHSTPTCVNGQQLQFLKKVTGEGSTEDCMSVDNKESVDPNSDTGSHREKYVKKVEKKRNNKRDHMELELTNIFKQKPIRHMCFFRGIIPSLETLDDDEIVEFQLSVLQILANIKKRKRASRNTSEATNVSKHGQAQS